MRPKIFLVAAPLTLLAIAISPAYPQDSAQLKTFLSQRIGLTPEQLQAVQNGQPFAKNMDSRTPAEIFVFGVIYINAAPESYVKWATDSTRLRQIPGYLAFNYFSNPPQLSDLSGFGFDSDDIKNLQSCKPGNCVVQLPASTMNDLRNSVDWSAPNIDEQVNQFAQKLALARLLEYQKLGDRILGAVYNDKSQQVNVADQFKYMLSYTQALPRDLPEFYNYLLNYPDNKPANVDDSFYWDKVKFGLKPTLRMVHVLTLHGDNPTQPAFVIAEKQLYSSHYFETALDLTFCIRDSDRSGFFLVKAMGSEQAGLTGFKGSIVRKVAVSHSVSDLQSSLAAIKSTLEHPK